MSTAQPGVNHFIPNISTFIIPNSGGCNLLCNLNHTICWLAGGFFCLSSHLYSLLQRFRSTNEKWPHQSRAGVFNRVHSRVVQIGQTVSLPFYGSSTYRHHPLIDVHHPRSDQSSRGRSHHPYSRISTEKWRILISNNNSINKMLNGTPTADFHLLGSLFSSRSFLSV